MVSMILMRGHSLGPFKLGSTLKECITEIQSNSRDFRNIKIFCTFENETSEVGKSNKKSDIILDIKECGIYLRFDSIQQRLKLIDVYDLRLISIYYHKQVLTSNKDDEENTFARIYNIMGLTHPGSFDSKRNLYYIEYDGLWLSFLLNYDPGPNFCVDLNDGTSPTLSRLIVFYGKNGIANHELPPLAQQLSSIQSSKVKPDSMHLYAYYFETIHVLLNVGIKLGWRNRRILFGSSVQDVLSDIGPPYKIFYKYTAKEQIMKSEAVASNELIQRQQGKDDKVGCDYFFNYVVLGLDILFDGFSHKVTKFILHTNNVGHPDFNRWCKCNFVMKPFDDSKLVITSDSKWKDVTKIMGNAKGSPMMFRSLHGRIQSLNDEKGKKSNQSIKIYGYQSVLFEVMGNDSGSIASVTLFHEENFKELKRAKSIALDDDEQPSDRIENEYKIPTSAKKVEQESHEHSSIINPSPLSISIEEAAQSQLEFKVNDKYSKQKKTKKKKKRQKKHIKHQISSPQLAPVEIGIKANKSNDQTQSDEIHENEMFDNIKL